MKLNRIKDSVLLWGPASEQVIKQLKTEARLVIVPELRPSLLGLKHNLKLLKEEGVSCVCCTDNMTGILFFKKKISKVVICYDKKTSFSIRAINGSLYIYLLAKAHNINVSFMPAGKLEEGLTLDRDASLLDGKSFVLDRGRQDCLVACETENIKLED